MKTDAQYIQNALHCARNHAVGDQGQVGAVLVSTDGQVFSAASDDPVGLHAEQVVLSAAGEAAVGATLYVTIQPGLYRSDDSAASDSELIIAAGVVRVVVGSTNKKYPLAETTEYFAKHRVEFVLVDDAQLSQDCLDLFVSTGADQNPKIKKFK